MVGSQFIIEQRISTGRVFLSQLVLSMLGRGLRHQDGRGWTHPGAGGSGAGSAFGRRLLVFLLARNLGVVVSRQW